MSFSGINSYNYVSPYYQSDTSKKTTDSDEETGSTSSNQEITKDYISSLSYSNQKSYNSSLLSGFTSANKLSGSSDIFSSLSSSFTTLELMKSGAYSKLINKYYSQMNSEDTEEQDLALDLAKKSATELNKAANAISSRDLYEEKADRTEEEQRDEILAAAKEFVSAYNDAISDIADVDDVRVLQKGVSMVSMTSATSGALSRIGITIGDDNKLSIDEEKFSEASIGEIKAVFAGSNSYSSSIAQKASMAANSASVLGYKANGSYNYTYSTSGILNMMF